MMGRRAVGHAITLTVLCCCLGVIPPLVAAASTQQTYGSARGVLDVQSNSTCKTTKGVVQVMLAVLEDKPAAKKHGWYWLSTVTKRLYAHAHNMPLYVVSHQLQQKRAVPWEKLIAVDAAMQHSCAEWVWLTHGSAWVVNATINIQDIIDQAVKDSTSKGGATPDVLIAKDCRGINAGSVLFRNTPWTRQHLADLWFTDGKALPEVDKLKEQASIIKMLSIPGVAPHYYYVKQRSINAYPEWSKCSDGSGMYKNGDGVSILLHAPGYFKDWLAMDKLEVADALHPSNLVHHKQNRDVAVYAIYPHDKPPTTVQKEPLFPSRDVSTLYVLFSKSPVAGPSSDDVSAASFKVDVARRPPGAANPGWPVSRPLFVRQAMNTFFSFARLHHSRPGDKAGTDGKAAEADTEDSVADDMYND